MMSYKRDRQGLSFFALTLILGFALPGLVGCGEKEDTKPVESSSEQEQVEKEETFEPKISVADETQEVIAKDKSGADVKFVLKVQTPTLSGVEAEIIDEFDTAFDGIVDAWADQLTGVVASLEAQSLSCQQAEGCEIPVEIQATVAEVYEGVGTVLTTSGVQLGTTSYSYSVDSFALDLKTGDEVQIDKYADTNEESARQRIDRAVAAELAKNQACQGSELEITAETAWSPTPDGLVLSWDQRSVVSNACGYVTVTVPWEDDDGDGSHDDAAALVIPACEDQATTATLDELQFRLEKTETGNQLSEKQTGPIAQAAMQSATQVQACEYWPATAGDVMETVTISELDDAGREDFISQLRASDYVESEFEGGTLFLLTVDAGTRNATFSRHLFVGNAWINQRGNGGSEAISEIALTRDALASLRAVNPGL